MKRNLLFSLVLILISQYCFSADHFVNVVWTVGKTYELNPIRDAELLRWDTSDIVIVIFCIDKKSILPFFFFFSKYYPLAIFLSESVIPTGF